METSLFQTISKKSNNDRDNKLREKELLRMVNETETQTNDIKLRDQWKTILKGLCPIPFERMRLEHKGGRSNNYDFKAIYETMEGKEIIHYHIEYKHRSKNLIQLPQILSLSEKVPLLQTSYAEYYYHNALDNYLSLNANDTATYIKPSLDDYLRYIHQPYYNKHPFFQMLYDTEAKYKKEKHKIVNESIHYFLEHHAASINLHLLQEKLIQTQLNKKFILYDGKQFHTAAFQESDFNHLSYGGIKNKNTIVLHSETYTYNILLRWRNHKGILFPAFQISVRK